MALEKLYTIKGAAEYLEIKEKTVGNYIEMGLLRCTRLGVREGEDPRLPDSRHPIRIPETALKEFVDKGMTNQVSAIQIENAEKIDERYSEGLLGEEVNVPTIDIKKK